LGSGLGSALPATFLSRPDRQRLRRMVYETDRLPLGRGLKLGVRRLVSYPDTPHGRA
jgi:hypothetical protein